MKKPPEKFFISADQDGPTLDICQVYVSKCSTSIQIPHIQTVLTKHIEVNALGHKT